MNAPHSSAESTPDLQVEIAHLLLLDVVGYSKLLVEEQVLLIQELTEIVRATECFRNGVQSGKLIRVATGDGMALAFFSSPEEPARCALEISLALQDYPQIQLRMGVHSGPVNRILDVNEKTNIAGAGINVAQRVLDCGDAGHILLSAHIAEDLAEVGHWRAHLYDLGECEVKHGLRLHLFNLYKDGLGNPEVPEKLRRRKPKRKQDVTILPIGESRTRFFVVSVLLASTAALLIGLLVLAHRGLLPGITTPSARAKTGAWAAIPQKSVAVLPFENLSAQQENTYFADGVQDEILTGLAKVADLKVISRTSTLQYKSSAARNLRKIAKALGVVHVLEGTVQRAGGRVRINAQLIDARTDSQVWAERYDRDLADVFAIESEVAEKIVAQLQAKISPVEKAAMGQKPTTDFVAYDLYIHAKTLITTSGFSTPQLESLTEAVRLLNEAIERDPEFALAYYQLALAHDQLYFSGIDHTPARLGLAEAAIQSFTRLRPNSGEAHLALARHLYLGYLEYDRARTELSVAVKNLPNESTIFLFAGFIDRRQGRWDESTKNLERAAELDPRNTFVLQQLTNSYVCLRRYADAERVLDRAIRVDPKDSNTRAFRAGIELRWHADPLPLRSVIETIITTDPREAKNIAQLWLEQSLCERDAGGAARALAALPVAGCYEDRIPFPRAWCEGIVARLGDDRAAAQSAFTSARSEAAKLVEAQHDYPEGLCALGMADASLGNKDDAIREGRRAVELLPVTKDSVIGAMLVKNLALIYAWTGEKDLAFEQLSTAANIPGFLSYGELRLHPNWDPLRENPRFEKIVASLGPK